MKKLISMTMVPPPMAPSHITQGMVSEASNSRWFRSGNDQGFGAQEFCVNGSIRCFLRRTQMAELTVEVADSLTRLHTAGVAIAHRLPFVTHDGIRIFADELSGFHSMRPLHR